MKEFPKSEWPEIQVRIDRAVELFEQQTEEEIFWMRWQAACTSASKERLGNNESMKPESEKLNIINPTK